MIPIVPAFGFDASLPVRVLAAIGGGAVGGLLLGVLVHVVVKLTFKQVLPGGVMWLVRALGGVACGLLVWSLLGGGGLGLGLGGGGDSGKDKGSADDKGKARKERKEKKEEKEKNKDRGKKDSGPTPPGQELRVEVLGSEDLKKIAGDKFDPRKRYRVPGQAQLLSLEEVKKLIFERREKKPPLRELNVVLYRNSPAQDKEQVTDLVGYAEDLGGKDGEKLKVSYSVHRDQDAPRE
jgi:hypothetical protein